LQFRSMKILAILLMFCSVNTVADPITYLISGTVSGTTEPINGTSAGPDIPFTNEQFVISLTADTFNIINDGGVPRNPGFDVDAVYTISNLGSGVFSPLSLAGCAGGGCGEQISLDRSTSTLSLRTDFGFFPIVVLTSPVFATYDLATLVGPLAVTASSGLPDGNPVGIQTSQLQYLFLDQFVNVTFSAVSEIQGVPEPRTSGYITVGLGILALVRFRKRR
jgi:hypothetical protein